MGKILAEIIEKNIQELQNITATDDEMLEVEVILDLKNEKIHIVR